MENIENVSGLVSEYRCVFDGIPFENDERLQRAITKNCDWTQEASTQLIELARNYGVFMLRNALAIAIVLNKEDGEYGF